MSGIALIGGAGEGLGAALGRRFAKGGCEVVLSSRSQGEPSARLLGTRQRTSLEMAAFANTTLVRYLDCNDTYASRGTGHPSDMIPAVLAAAEGGGADGCSVITAIVLAHEVFCRLADAVPLKGWDQGMFVGIGTACGAGKLLGLDGAALGHAISIAITSGRSSQTASNPSRAVAAAATISVLSSSSSRPSRPARTAGWSSTRTIEVIGTYSRLVHRQPFNHPGQPPSAMGGAP